MRCPIAEEEIRAVIRFLHSKKVKPAEIIRRMKQQYENCLNRSKHV